MRGSAAVVLAATSDFHHAGLLSILTVLAAILAAFFRATIASRMRTHDLILCHRKYSWIAQ